MITVDARALGRKQCLVPQFSVPLPPEVQAGGEPLTLRSLITRVVLHEVAAFRERQEQRRLLAVFSEAGIREAAARGRVAPGGRDLHQRVDDDDAVAAALQAFEDGIYMVILDGEEQRELDREVQLRPDSRLTFLRLVMLAGG